MRRTKTNFIVVHCSASQNLPSIDAKTIDRWHKERGFNSIGYHYVVKTGGEVEEGRKLSEIGAHVVNYNHNSVGICLIGGVDRDGNSVNNFKPKQFEALRELIEKLLVLYPKAVIKGHRDFPNVKKDCPCFDVNDWWTMTGRPI